MKKILITGANSYIGISFETYINQNYAKEYVVDTVDMTNDGWRENDFGSYDVVFHVAGIAHIKETSENAHLYYEVNEKLAIDVASKAKKSGIKQFIILSSMSVYGIEEGTITKNTVPNPNTNYGKSKYNADLAIENMATENFIVAVIRPPMVYGKGCKGNYQTLKKFALKSLIFPKFNNERSMISIDNLVFFVERVIRERLDGVFFPQDVEYVNTSNMVELMANAHGKRIYLTKIFNPFIHLGQMCGIGVLKKVFGNLVYEKCDCVEQIEFSDYIKYIERD